MRRAPAVVALGTALVLAVPATALGQSEAIPPVRAGVHVSNECGAAQAAYRTSISGAKAEKRASFRAAKLVWRAGVAVDRAVLRQALSDADTNGERKSARKVFRKNTADDRHTRQSSKKAAIKEFRHDKSDARKARRAAMRSCRS